LGAAAVVTRHQFLALLHDLVQPAVYLEIGVQHGLSLALASPPCRAVGVDPDPMVRVPIPADGSVLACTSDEFFADSPHLHLGGPVDLAFIDGMHLVEYALRDFMGCERLARPGSLIVLDDVLPRNQAEAAREPCPGDWTGDVWRVHPYLAEHRPDLRLTLVDTSPTGLLVVSGLDPADTTLSWQYMHDVDCHMFADAPPVPAWVLDRVEALAPDQALAKIHTERGTHG
jgi:predicted O-methyltransferase YrrM